VFWLKETQNGWVFGKLEYASCRRVLYAYGFFLCNLEETIRFPQYYRFFCH